MSKLSGNAVIYDAIITLPSRQAKQQQLKTLRKNAFYLPKMGGSRKLVASYGLRNYPPGFSYHVLLLRDPQRSCCSQQASFYTVSNWLQASICCWCYPNSMDETQRSHADQFCSETFPDIGVKAVKKKRSLPWDIIIFAKSDIYPELFLLVDMKKEPWGNPLL